MDVGGRATQDAKAEPHRSGNENIAKEGVMTDYRRARTPGATWFFTVALAERRNNNLLLEKIDVLRAAFRRVQNRHPFRMDAVVILPDHLHCMWTLPVGDAEYSMRWGLIKGNFSRTLAQVERRSESRRSRGERGIWQRRFWEHRIRDETDYARHVDYIHWNPVKHGYVKQVIEWPYSSFHDFVRAGDYPRDWGGRSDAGVTGGE
jgi:putative transposase